MSRGLDFKERMERRSLAESHLMGVKKALLPELDVNENKGYNGTEFIGNVYQIYRTILHRLAIDYAWENVYSSETLPSGNMGTIKIEPTNNTTHFTY